MLRHPIKSTGIEVLPIAADAALVGKGLAYSLVQGATILRILELLDGRSLESLCDELQAELSVPEIMHGVLQLVNLGAAFDLGVENRASTSITSEPSQANLAVNAWRREDAESTLARLEALISPESGPLPQLQEIKLPAAAPFFAYRADLWSRSPDVVASMFKSDLRTYASGKGSTRAKAKLSALAEAIERYSGLYRPGDEDVYDSLAKLADVAVAPSKLMGFSPAQVSSRNIDNDQASVLHWVPPALPPEQKIAWSKAWSLTHKRDRLVPTGWAFYDTPKALGGAFSVACSNGAAAGSSLEEAIFYGTLELVERDAVGIWWYNQLVRPQVDLASIDDHFLRQMQAYVSSKGRDLWVVDLTHDLGIPVFAALSRRRGSELDGFMLGFGAHVDPQEAAVKAVTELAQMLAEEPTAALVRPSPRAKTPPPANALAFLQPQTQARPLRRCGVDCTFDLAKANAMIQGRMVKLGLEVLVVDQSRATTGLAVAKVIVPGLQHFWRRLGPGRLYQVPVTLAWRQQSCLEAGLNPWDLYV